MNSFIFKLLVNVAAGPGASKLGLRRGLTEFATLHSAYS